MFTQQSVTESLSLNRPNPHIAAVVLHLYSLMCTREARRHDGCHVREAANQILISYGRTCKFSNSGWRHKLTPAPPPATLFYGK